MKEFNTGEHFIYVSHSYRDTERVRPIVRAIDDAGYNIYLDELFGSRNDYPKFSASVIEKCSTELIFFTAAARESAIVSNDLLTAIKHGKRVVVLFLDGEDELIPSDIIFSLNNFPRVFAKRCKTEEELLRALLSLPEIAICKKSDE